MFYTPKSEGFTPIVNGRKTRILKSDEPVHPGDWYATQNPIHDKIEWYQLSILDITPRYPNGRIIIRYEDNIS